jgi:hypothetical protein
MEEFKRRREEERKIRRHKDLLVCACKVNYTFLGKCEKGVNNTWREASFGKFNRKVLNFTGRVKEVQLNELTTGGQLNV